MYILLRFTWVILGVTTNTLKSHGKNTSTNNHVVEGSHLLRLQSTWVVSVWKKKKKFLCLPEINIKVNGLVPSSPEKGGRLINCLAVRRLSNIVPLWIATTHQFSQLPGMMFLEENEDLPSADVLFLLSAQPNLPNKKIDCENWFKKSCMWKFPVLSEIAK